MFTKYTAGVLLALAALIAPPAASAQGLEILGSRPAALSAFVAVADDPSAIAWNPSGLVSGPIVSVAVDIGRHTHEPSDGPAAGTRAGRIGSTLVALGSLPAGVAYYRLATTNAQPVSPADPGSPDRQEGQVLIQHLVTSHLGVTVQQSVGGHFTLGATLKLVRGSVGGETRRASSWDDAFTAAERVETDGRTRGDVDIGAMASAGRLRVGLLVRNLTEPSFGGDEDSDAAALPRHARLGVAWGDRWPGTARTIVAFDADMTHVPHAGGERRDVAAGVERWFAAGSVGLRGGVRASTLGDARPVVSGGASYAVRAGMYVDAYFARGRDGDRAWGIAARLAY